MKLDILAIGAHPDDVELGCGGTIAKYVKEGKKVGIIDLTRGELGTRGSAETRDEEAAISAEILGISVRENLGFEDGFFKNDKSHQLQLTKLIRKYQPEIVLANAPHDRHPEHVEASTLISDTCFLSGLDKVETKEGGQTQQAWRPKNIYHYIQFLPLEPSFVLDVSEFMETKMAAVKAYKSQFHDPNSIEPETVISSPGFLKNIEERASDLGRIIGVKYGEGFITPRYVGVKDLFDLV